MSIGEAAFPDAEPLLRSGRIDFLVDPRPRPPVAREYRVKLLYRNQRQVFARIGHPLRATTRLSALQDLPWLCNGLLARAEQDLEDLFTRYRQTPPRETIPAPDVVLIQKAGLPLPPAAELFAQLPCQQQGQHIPS